MRRSSARRVRTAASAACIRRETLSLMPATVGNHAKDVNSRVAPGGSEDDGRPDATATQRPRVATERPRARQQAAGVNSAGAPCKYGRAPCTISSGWS